ncbi:DUF3037 domain-containing protein [Roseiconus lacunae]|uniref:DUF3037 domain-containing protein n=1 Tax=Roseiconus lacunae TaxID=2605694 RepID=A0ABT7PBU6_9BACT|nr:DUF3037 domain-containing protein [Roseiconus lacunae]MDM4013926.1 DUF3037 domain-containing protein [Roseiconus lacunae]
MTPTKGYYSIVQYCPDLARRETVNVGIVLLVPDLQFLHSRMANDNERVRHFFGISGEEAKQVSLFKKSFKHRIEVEQLAITSPQALQKFIDTRGNQFRLTEPAFVKVRQPQETLDQLFVELVGEQSEKAKRSSLKSAIDARFVKAGVSDKIRRDVPVSMPILDQDIKIPFGFQNGEFHLLQPARFESERERDNFDRALKFSTEGKLFQEHPDARLGKLQFNVIGRFPSKSDKSISMVREVLGEANIRLHSEHDLSELIDEIQRTAKPITD